MSFMSESHLVPAKTCGELEANLLSTWRVARRNTCKWRWCIQNSFHCDVDFRGIWKVVFFWGVCMAQSRRLPAAVSECLLASRLVGTKLVQSSAHCMSQEQEWIIVLFVEWFLASGQAPKTPTTSQLRRWPHDRFVVWSGCGLLVPWFVLSATWFALQSVFLCGRATRFPHQSLRWKNYFPVVFLWVHGFVHSISAKFNFRLWIATSGLDRSLPRPVTHAASSIQSCCIWQSRLVSLDVIGIWYVPIFQSCCSWQSCPSLMWWELDTWCKLTELQDSNRCMDLLPPITALFGAQLHPESIKEWSCQLSKSLIVFCFIDQSKLNQDIQWNVTIGFFSCRWKVRMQNSVNFTANLSWWNPAGQTTRRKTSFQRQVQSPRPRLASHCQVCQMPPCFQCGFGKPWF